MIERINKTKGKRLAYPLLIGQAFVSIEFEVLTLNLFTPVRIRQSLGIRSKILKASQAPTVKDLIPF